MFRPSGIGVTSRSAALLLIVALLGSCGNESPATPVDAGSPPVTAGPPPSGDGYPVADILVAVSHPQAKTLEYRISCEGDTATVFGADLIAADAACRRLADPFVTQRLVAGVPLDRVCMEIYGGPDVARITGSADGSNVDATIDRSNGCGISDWDNLLLGILPRALGLDG